MVLAPGVRGLRPLLSSGRSDTAVPSGNMSLGGTPTPHCDKRTSLTTVFFRLSKVIQMHNLAERLQSFTYFTYFIHNIQNENTTVLNKTDTIKCAAAKLLVFYPIQLHDIIIKRFTMYLINNKALHETLHGNN